MPEVQDKEKPGLTAAQVQKKARDLGVTQEVLADHRGKNRTIISAILAWGDKDPLADLDAAIDEIVINRAEKVTAEQEAVVAA